LFLAKRLDQKHVMSWPVGSTQHWKTLRTLPCIDYMCVYNMWQLDFPHAVCFNRRALVRVRACVCACVCV
jgi:hypothetical protein